MCKENDPGIAGNHNLVAYMLLIPITKLEFDLLIIVGLLNPPI